MTIEQIIAAELKVKPQQVHAALELLDGGNTIPFIARYRKEATGTLDEEALRSIEERAKYLRQLEERRAEILAAIEAQEKLTPELKTQIEAAVKMQELEDLYLPYRPKKRTRAQIAREKGLEPLAELITQQVQPPLSPVAPVRHHPQVSLPAEALDGGGHVGLGQAPQLYNITGRVAVGVVVEKEQNINLQLVQPVFPGQGLKTGGVIPFESVHKTYLLLHSPTSFML